MKKICKHECFHIISEPGDCTHYDYLFVNNQGDYMFIPYNNSLKYPEKIESFEVCEINNKNEDRILSMAKSKDCNPYTIKECLRTIEEYKKGKLIC